MTRSLILLPLLFAACRCGPKPTPSDKPAVSATAVTPKTVSLSPDGSSSMNRNLDCPRELADTRLDGTKPNSYIEPTDVERKVLGEAIAKLARGEAATGLDGIGFETVAVASWPDATLVREKGRRRGGGAYVIRRSSTSPLLVEAPHTFFDEGTFPLGCELFQRSGARGFFFNTSHRYKSAPKTASGAHPADVAHSATSLFHAATAALVAQQKPILLIQVHGFATREVDARAVVSSGEKRSGTAWVAKAAKGLADVMGGKVLRFPEDTDELGATTNVQGMAVRRAGGKFLHIEMDDEMRRRLLSDATLRGRALDTMFAAISED